VIVTPCDVDGVHAAFMTRRSPTLGIVMTMRRFRHDIERGLGSALIELRASDDTRRYLDAVRYACLHVTSSNVQDEGPRGWYLHQAATLVDGDGILVDITARYALAFPQCHTDLFEQLSNIVSEYALTGNGTARDALHAKYDQLLLRMHTHRRFRYGYYTERDEFFSLCRHLLTIDGWSAFKSVTADVATTLLPQDPDTVDAGFIECARHRFGRQRVDTFLRRRAAGSPEWNRYWLSASRDFDYERETNPLRREHPPLETPSLADVVSAEGGYCRKLSSQDARAVLAAGTDLMNGLELLAAHLTPDDEPVFRDEVERIPTAFWSDDWHHAVEITIRALGRMRGKPRTDVLNYVYRNTWCSSCRVRIVRLMYLKGIVTPTLQQEFLSDSHPDIRSLATKALSTLLA
jgi:hypothetical protein